MQIRSNEHIKYEDEIKSMSHEEFKGYCLKLSKDIQEYCNTNNLRIDYVVPILRSGAVPAVYIANELNLIKFAPIQVKKIRQDGMYDHIILLNSLKELDKDKELILLIVEGTYSSGDTVNTALEEIRKTLPKAGSKELRPLGIPAYEDKLVQGAMADVLNEIYENIFLDCSYGFRANRDCHKAIKKLDEIIMKKKINYVVDADIKGFFNNVNHEWLIKFLKHTIQDQKFIRYIGRFLKSGIMEDMQHYESDKGTPQGGIISPILANVYLHYVLDLWFELYIKIKCKGGAVEIYSIEALYSTLLKHKLKKLFLAN